MSNTPPAEDIVPPENDDDPDVRISVLHRLPHKSIYHPAIGACRTYQDS